MGRRIVITSGKGGVGKTTITANLGLSLAMRGKSVALIDADIGLNNLDVAMGMEGKVIYDIGDVAMGRCRLKQALIFDSQLPNICLLPSAKIHSDKIKTQDFSAIISELSSIFDYVLIDCPAGIELSFHRAVASAMEAIVVATPHINSVRDADKVFSLLSTYNLNSVGLVVNRIRQDMVSKGNMMSARDISELLRARLIGAIPEDDTITALGTPNWGAKDKVNRAYRLFAACVMGEASEIPDSDGKNTGSWRNIFKRGRI